MSTVLILGILIGTVGTAYLWGVPLIEKRTTITEFETAENFILETDRAITDVVNAGEGQKRIRIPKGIVYVIPYDDTGPDNNSIILEFVVKQPMLSNATVPIRTSSLEETAAYGETEARIITARGEPFADGYKIAIKLHYRELDTQTPPLKGYKIAIQKGVATGSDEIVITYDRTITLEDQAGNGGDLILSYVNIDTV